MQIRIGFLSVEGVCFLFRVAFLLGVGERGWILVFPPSRGKWTWGKRKNIRLRTILATPAILVDWDYNKFLSSQ
jgi:hypothetical protein